MMISRFLTTDRPSRHSKRRKYSIVASGSGNILNGIQSPTIPVFSTTALSQLKPPQIAQNPQISNIMCHVKGTDCVVHAMDDSSCKFSCIQMNRLQFTTPTAVRIVEGRPTYTGQSILQLRYVNWLKRKNSILTRSALECRLYTADTQKQVVESAHNTYISADDSSTSYTTPSPYVPEIVVVHKSGNMLLWDAETSKIIQTYKHNDNSNENKTYMAEYMKHPRCLWSVRLGDQHVEMIDMRSNVKDSKTIVNTTNIIGCGNKTFEGMGGTMENITALHNDTTSSFQCIVGSKNRIVLFDTRYTSCPVRMWHNNHIGQVNTIHSFSFPNNYDSDEEEEKEKDNDSSGAGSSMYIATSYGLCSSTCLMHNNNNNSPINGVHSGGLTSFDPPYIIEHWHRVDSNVKSLSCLAGFDIISKNDVHARNEEKNDEVGGIDDLDIRDDDRNDYHHSSNQSILLMNYVLQF